VQFLPEKALEQI